MITRMWRVQFGDDGRCFAVVLSIWERETKQEIIRRASEAIRKEYGLSDDDLVKYGIPKLRPIPPWECVVFSVVDGG